MPSNNGSILFASSWANTQISLALPTLKLHIIEIGQLPLYNQDLDDDPPSQWIAFRERIKASDAVVCAENLIRVDDVTKSPKLVQ